MKERYGPWALIVGGSEGIGEHLARKLGAAGINIVLVARRPDPLARTARQLREEYGIEVRCVEIDITNDNFLQRIREVTDDLEIGLLAHNVGGGGGSTDLLVRNSLDAEMVAVKANPVALTKLAHHFGGAMARRRRGGLLMIGSLAGNAGCYGLATYSAAKAYNQVFMEALWAELEPCGVDVLAFPLGATDTPSRARSGTADTDEMPVASAAEVAQMALDRLPHGPVFVAPENIGFFEMLCSQPRRQTAIMQRDLMMKMLPRATGD